MELLQLKYFYSAARYESITRAAQQYGIPQPAMSQTISRLEKELGTQLFDRKSNRLTLNENGKLFLKHVEAVLDNLSDGIMALKEKNGDIKGEISLLVLENRNMIIDWIVEFARLNPEVSFSICHNNIGDHSFNFDLCVSSRRMQPHLRKGIPLICEEIMLAVPYHHALAKNKSVTLNSLKDERFITLPSQYSLSQTVKEYCRAHGFEPKISIICDDPYYIRKYVSLGMGVSFVPSFSWQGLWNENVIFLPIQGEKFTRTTYLIWDDRRYMTKAVQQFRDYIIEKASDYHIYQG
ncbi:MAG TPA: LysR family transcriptional regulator [Clostridiales bacterium]|nr:LysR family transcriptional regulator [Clostridiales bacterium]